MIARLTGVVAKTDANSVVLDVNGVGYRAYVPLGVLASLPSDGSRVTLHTCMVVRDDDISLFGFRSEEELRVFQALLGVAGVGPRVALSLLSVLEAPDLARAIAGGDAKALTRVPGVGPKLAQRILLELGDTMASLMFEQRIEAGSGAAAPAADQLRNDIVEALVSLQYNRTDARRAADQVLRSSGGSADLPSLIRQALNILSGGQL